MTTGAPSDPLSLIGKTLAGHFLVQRLAAEGRTSFIYKGEHVGPKRPVALKCLKISLPLDAPRADTFLKRLREETRTYGQIARNEPHFVRSIGTGMTPTASGTHVPYSVLEWLDGFSLAQDIDMRRRVGEARTLEETAELLAPVARALAAAHVQKVMHGDVGSNNIFLSRIFGDTIDVKVLDFGVSRVVRDVTLELSPSGSPPPTNDPFWSTSPGYAAPEQEDRSLGEIGTWTDVYALAVVFMETLVGKLIRDRSPLPRANNLTLPEGVERVLERALMKTPKERWPSAGEFWAALEDSLRVAAMKLPSRPPAPAPSPSPSPTNAVAQAGPDRTIRILTPMQAELRAKATPPKGTVTPALATAKATIRMGSIASPEPPRAASAAPVPAAGAKPIVPPAVPKKIVAPAAPRAKTESKPIEPKAGETKATESSSSASPDDVKPIVGSPVIFAQPAASPEKGVVRKPVAPPPFVKRNAATDAKKEASPPPPSASPPSSGRTSAPPPPAPGAVVPVAPGPVPAPPPPSQKSPAAALATTKGPSSQRVPVAGGQKAVDAAPPKKATNVFIEDLPSVIVEGGAAPPVDSARGAETIRLNLPPASPDLAPPSHGMQGAMSSPMHFASPGVGFVPPPPQPTAPIAPPAAQAGLPPPPLVARPGVIVMPPGAPPSPHRRMTYDERRGAERKRLYIVIAASFLFAFLAGGTLLMLHLMRHRGS